MKNIIFLKIKSSIIILVLIFSCDSNNSKKTIEKIYYYAHFDYFNNDINTYEAARIIDSVDRRKIIRYIYNKNKMTTISNYYKIKPDGLFLCYNMMDTIGHCFFTIKKDICVTWKHPDESMNIIAQIEQCYIGKEFIKIEKREECAYKFLATVGSCEGYEEPLKYYIYYDKSFIFLKDEDIYTGKSYRKKVDSIPQEFRILLDSIIKD
jgi:hypothetical protein